MHISCPSCESTNIKKNSNTHYGKQNHKCNCCCRQFVLNNRHTKSPCLREQVSRALKERLSLRAICRLFDLSLSWLTSFGHTLWNSTPRNLGITEEISSKIKRLQVFGIQADEMWYFVGKRKQKRWIWIAYDPTHRLVVACHIGKRGNKAAKKFWKKNSF
jgi:insertion element IS1 protein InsB